MIAARTGAIQLMCVLAVGAGFLILEGGNDFYLGAATLTLLYVIVAVGLNVIWGLAGQFSMAHVGLMAIAAYVASYTVVKWGWSFWFGALAAVFVTMTFSLVIGVVALPFREMHFAIATLAFALLLVAVLNNWSAVGGSGGLISAYTIPRISLPLLDQLDPATPQGWLVVVLVALLGLLACQLWILQTRLGRAFLAVREDEALAQSIGVDVKRYKVTAFVISAVPSAIGGVLYAPYLTFIHPAAFGLQTLITIILIVAVGGAGTLIGPVIGGLLFQFLPELANWTGEARLAIYGTALIAVVLFTPGGVVGTADTVLRRRRGRRKILARTGPPEPRASENGVPTVTEST
jgi:ABC-type branched-subunit amino acid transport system permease subunit